MCFFFFVLLLFRLVFLLKVSFESTDNAAMRGGTGEGEERRRVCVMKGPTVTKDPGAT